MLGDIINFPPPGEGEGDKEDRNLLGWQCANCDHFEFLIYEDGSVYCADCFALAENLIAKSSGDL